MIVLHQFPPGAGLPNLSPFCLKLETWLRMAGLDYRCDYTMNPRSGPQGKLPYITFRGERIPDSARCITVLEQAFGIDLDKGLVPEQRAVARRIQTLFEDEAYWAVLYSRWADPVYWPHTRRWFFAGLPAPLRLLVPPLARRGMLASLRAEGTGRLPQEQVYRRVEQMLETVATLLADQDFLLGPTPTTIDAVGYGFLAQLYLAQLPNPFGAALARHANLRAYAERMLARYYAVPA